MWNPLSKRSAFPVLAVAVAAAAAAVVPRPTRAADPDPTVAMTHPDTPTAADLAFAVDLYRRATATVPATANALLSPYSVRTAMALAAAGSSGRTAEQMARGLRLPAGEAPPAVAFGPDVALSVANSIWAQRGLTMRPAFVDRATAAFRAGAEQVDFAGGPDAARATINGWVSDHTAGKITDLLPAGSVDRATRLVLANAVHFKAQWEHPFAPHATRPVTFHLAPGRDADAPMMAAEEQELGVCQTDAFDAVELPYKGEGGAAMLVVIPRAVDGLAALERSLTTEAVDQWLAGLKPTEVEVSLPQFKATAAYDLKDALAAMGMGDAFDPARADFSALVDPAGRGGERLSIGGVFHKAYVAVDEEGTEAAAATATVMPAGAMPPRQMLRLVADRPFLYLIRDRRTGTVLFMGRCADPRA